MVSGSSTWGIEVDIPKRLIPFFEGVEDIPFKNDGGCLFFTYSFWLWVKENNYPTESFQIVQYDHEDKRKIKHNLQFINGDRGNPVASYHFSWIYDEEEYDADGRHVGSDYLSREILKGLNERYSPVVDEFCLKALNRGGWNSTFKRKSAIEIVESNLLIDLSGVRSC